MLDGVGGAIGRSCSRGAMRTGDGTARDGAARSPLAAPSCPGTAGRPGVGHHGTMRRSAGWATGLVVWCALLLVGGSPATAAPGDPAPIGTVGLTPTHGPPDAPISATYHLVG